jgi:erythromycin esterase-like protein
MRSLPGRPASVSPDELGLVRRVAVPLSGSARDHDAVLERIGDARIVLLGEASHGTHEFYAHRAALTKRLVQERGFNAIAVEADWPDALRVDRWVRLGDEDRTAEEALRGFERFPAWMWRNDVIEELVGWLRAHNESVPDPRDRVGFFGLDLYSLHRSVESVLRYLADVDPVAARRARDRYACFDHFGGEAQGYGYAASSGIVESCEDAVVEQLRELSWQAGLEGRRDGLEAADEAFFAEHNARLVRNAERYYRAMFRGRVSSWNLRDSHMADTLDLLLEHLERTRGNARVVVWAHNSHLGDARATEMAERDEHNVGQLVRERHGRDAVTIGFTTHHGTVTAARDWDAPPDTRLVVPGRPDAYEGMLHDLRMGDLLLMPDRDPDARGLLGEPRLERFIGVIYRPETERQSHYMSARLAEQFDAVIHVDESHALRPLERTGVPDRTEPPETFPSGM